MTKATINITISPSTERAHNGGFPLQKQLSSSSCNSDNFDLSASMGRISLRSEGSQVSFMSSSRTPSRTASIHSHQSTPPVSAGDGGPGLHHLNGGAGSPPEDRSSERSFGSSQGGILFGTGQREGREVEEERTVTAMYMDREVVAVIKVGRDDETQATYTHTNR